MAGVELGRTHIEGLKDDVLTVVQLPVSSENPSLRGQPRMQRRPWERCQHREARQIDAGVERKFYGGVEHVQMIVIEPEHEAALDRDSQLVQIDNQLLVIN